MVIEYNEYITVRAQFPVNDPQIVWKQQQYTNSMGAKHKCEPKAKQNT